MNRDNTVHCCHARCKSFSRWAAAVCLASFAGVQSFASEVLLHERFEGRADGEISGNVRFVPEVVGFGGLKLENKSAAQFSGDAAIIMAEKTVASTDFTVEAFIKPGEQWEYAGIAGQWDEENSRRVWALVISPGNGVRFDIMSDGNFYGENSLSTKTRQLRRDNWYHVAAVSEGQESRIYINGHLRAKKIRPRAGIFSRTNGEIVTPIQIGNVARFAGQPRPFNGLIDEVRITLRALKPEEFLQTRERMPEPHGPVPDRFEMPFTARTREEALAWQQKSRARLLELVSARAPKKSLTELPLDFRIETSEDRGEYTLHHASFQGNDGKRYGCRWTVPKGAGRFPAVLCLHGHGGSAAAVFDPASPYHGFADVLARGGYCTLSPSFPHRNFAAVALWDLQRCVDILSEQKEVDAGRIGVMGLSMGGEWTMWVAACDERLRAAVVSGWMCTSEGVYAVPNCPCWELPGFVDLMDVCEVNLLMAPRPVLFESAVSDECFPFPFTVQGFERIAAGYKIFGAPGAAVQSSFPGGHQVNGNEAYPFLDKFLKGHAAKAAALKGF